MALPPPRHNPRRVLELVCKRPTLFGRRVVACRVCRDNFPGPAEVLLARVTMFRIKPWRNEGNGIANTPSAVGCVKNSCSRVFKNRYDHSKGKWGITSFGSRTHSRQGDANHQRMLHDESALYRRSRRRRWRCQACSPFGSKGDRFGTIRLFTHAVVGHGAKVLCLVRSKAPR